MRIASLGLLAQRVVKRIENGQRAAPREAVHEHRDPRPEDGLGEEHARQQHHGSRERMRLEAQLLDQTRLARCLGLEGRELRVAAGELDAELTHFWSVR